MLGHGEDTSVWRYYKKYAVTLGNTSICVVTDARNLRQKGVLAHKLEGGFSIIR